MSALRHEALLGVFGAQTHLDGVALEQHLALRQPQRLARRDAQLQGDQIQTRDGLGHRVFHLQTRVHFHEEMLAVLVQQKLQSACAFITNRLHGGHRSGPHAFSQRGIHGRRRRFFHQLLMTALHRAIPLAQMHHLTMAVRHDLNFDVARRGHGFFKNDRGVAKRIQRLRLGAVQQRSKFKRTAHQSHTAPATTRAGFDHHGVTDGLGFLRQTRRALVLALVARDAGHTRLQHQALGTGFVAHAANRLR